MKNFKILFVVLLAIFSSGLIQAQWLPAGAVSTDPIYRTGRIGVGISGVSNDKFSIYSHTASTQSGAAAVFGEAAQPTGFASWVRGVRGDTESGYGYAIGVQGNAFTDTPSNNGRAYGLFGCAGNATSNYNYGVFGQLKGTNNGTGILGWDRLSHPGWNGSTNGHWAGYFVGDLHVTDKIGIGITDPTESLHISEGVLKISGPNGYGGPMMLFSEKPQESDWGIEYVPPSQSAKPGLNFWKPFGSTNWGNHYLFLADDTGNVGVRTDNPVANLTVNGDMLIGNPNDPGVIPPGNNYKLYVQKGILTEKVKVASYPSAQWSDYVFEEDYDRNSIEKVADFVKENKHLPHVPSAQEVEANGINLAEMDATLLRQVEELWLHIIDLKIEIESLKKVNATLESGK